jgi:hypothetical protein
MSKLTQAALRSLIKKPGPHSDGSGPYFRVLGEGKAYFVLRFTVTGRERETSLGPSPELSLAEARERHADIRKLVRVDKTPSLRSAPPRPCSPARRPRLARWSTSTSRRVNLRLERYDLPFMLGEAFEEHLGGLRGGVQAGRNAEGRGTAHQIDERTERSIDGRAGERLIRGLGAVFHVVAVAAVRAARGHRSPS